MAERRMFAKSVIDCDLFIDMPQSARLLYYDLSMRADDDGFITPQKIIRMTGASKDDLSILIAKKFVIPFESGVVVIRHWRINNYLRNDRYTETSYTDEKAQLTLGKAKEYELRDTDGIPKDIPTVATGKVRLGKDSIGYTQKEIINKEKVEDVPFEEAKAKRFVKPTLEEAQAYISEKGYRVNAEQWFNFYETNGWKVGRNPMKDWKASIRYWNTTGYSNGTRNNSGSSCDDIDHGYNPNADKFANDEEGNVWTK